MGRETGGPSESGLDFSEQKKDDERAVPGEGTNVDNIEVAEVTKLDLGNDNPRINELRAKIEAGEEELTNEEAAELDLFEREHDCKDHGMIAYDQIGERTAKFHESADRLEKRGSKGTADNLRAGLHDMGELPQDQMKEVYDRYPPGTTKGMLESPGIYIQSSSTINTPDIRKPEQYIDTVMKFITESLEGGQNVEPASTEDVDRNVGIAYALKADGRGPKKRRTTEDNWQLHVASGRWEETFKQSVRECTDNLRGFAEAARVAGDTETADRVEQALMEIERKKLDLVKA